MNFGQIILILLVGLGASFVQRVCGFGLGIFAMLFLPHFIPDHTAAVTISCFFSCITTTYNSIKFRKNIPYKTVFPLLVASFVSIPIAVYGSVYISGDVFKIILGIVLIILSFYLLFFNSKVKIKPSVKNGLIAGTAGGDLGGLFSTGGPPAVLYMTYAAADKLAYFAGLQFYFCLTNYYATLFRITSGIVTLQVLIYTVIGLVGCMIGDILGKQVFDKLDAVKSKQVIYIAMIISGILMLL